MTIKAQLEWAPRTQCQADRPRGRSLFATRYPGVWIDPPRSKFLAAIWCGIAHLFWHKTIKRFDRSKPTEWCTCTKCCRKWRNLRSLTCTKK